MKLVAIDPGLKWTGLCVMDGSDVQTSEIRLSDGETGWRRMADLILAWVESEQAQPDGGIDCIGLEDFVFMAPKASHGLVKHAAQMGKIIGYLVSGLEEAGQQVVLVPSSQAQRGQPKGKAAKAAGIPGRNDHERASYYVAIWLKGTMRMAGQR